MIIPKKVKIGGIIYSVKVLPHWDDRGDADGMLSLDSDTGNTIYIGSELTKQAQEVTFFHEVLHAMNSTMNHEFLDSLAEQLYQVLHDNGLLKG